MTGEKTNGEIRTDRQNLIRRFTGSKALISPAVIIELILRFIAAFALAINGFFGGFHPLALALTTASGTGFRGAITISGAVIGYLCSGSFGVILKYVSACFLVYAVQYILRGTRLVNKVWMPSALSCLFLFCSQLLFDFSHGITAPIIISCILELLAVGTAAFFFKSALSPYASAGAYDRRGEYQHTIGTALLIAAVMASVSGITIFGIISLGRIFLVLAVFLIAFKGGASLGCTAGVIIGILADASAGGTPYFSIAYSISAFISGLLSRYGKLHAAAAFIVADAFVCILMWPATTGAAILYEVFIASVIFILLPNRQLAKLGAFFPGTGTSYGAALSKAYTSEKVSRASSAFRDLYSTVKIAAGVEKNDENIAAVFDRAAEASCRTCKNSSECWQRDYETTVDALNKLVPHLKSKGTASMENLPKYFTEKCCSPNELIHAINEEMRSLMYRRQYKARLSEKLSAAYDQFHDVAEVLDGISEELKTEAVFEPSIERRLQKFLRSRDIDASTAVFRDNNKRLHIEISGPSLALLAKDAGYLNKISEAIGVRLCSTGYRRGSEKLVLLEAEPYSVSVGTASARKQGQSVNGDQDIYFKTDEGVLYILLSDGMGSGEFAAKCSNDTIKILERFLRSGISPEISLRILNRLMLLKNEHELSSATVDLMQINLFSGEAKLFKYGAAPSYLRRGSNFRRIRCRSFSVGLGGKDNNSPDSISLKLAPGDRIIMLSDGTISGGDDNWISDLILETGDADCKDIAKSIIETAAAKFGSDDDMTALAMIFEERK